jgi:hypothetical protein
MTTQQFTVNMEHMEHEFIVHMENKKNEIMHTIADLETLMHTIAEPDKTNKIMHTIADLEACCRELDELKKNTVAELGELQQNTIAELDVLQQNTNAKLDALYHKGSRNGGRRPVPLGPEPTKSVPTWKSRSDF